MRIELINTGSELLLGFTVNTHANYIAGQLAERGLRLIRQTTVGDDRAEMRAAVSDALNRSDIILITGGLGPTSDDFTRDVVAELLGRRLIHNPVIADSIRERFHRRNRTMPESVLVQALVPEGATVLENPNGTAPGLRLDHAGKQVYLLPGPPRELKPMFEKLDLPRRARLDCRVFKVACLPESIVEESVAPVLKDIPGLELGYCARMGEVEVRILGENLDEPERRIRGALGDNIFGTAGDRLEEVVIKMLAGRTLATAESCTGGYIAHRLTNVSGSSAAFLTGYVTYANESKTRLLGVREETLKAHGAVSEATCREMAEGARRQADYALATTGIAGPTGGTADKPVGLVFIGLATPTKTTVERHVFNFDRETFKQLVSQYALDALRRELLEKSGGLRQPALPIAPVGRAALSAPLPRRKKLPHELPVFVRPDEAIFFLTICCRPRGKNQLCVSEIATAIFSSIETGQRRGDWWVHLGLLMPDHLHLVISFSPNIEMSKVISDWKKLLARTLHIRWQRDFFEHRLRQEESLREKAEYILQNPVRAGLVARAEDWEYLWMPEPESAGRAVHSSSQTNGALRAARPTGDER